MIGPVIHDLAQIPVQEALHKVRQRLFGRWWQRRPRVQGCYIWGKVGRGKTYLMDQFVSSCPTKRVKRLHFQTLLQEVHQHLHTQSQPDSASVTCFRSVARHLCRGVRVLCLDEFQVEDIADAMILRDVFQALFRQGIVLVTTSNMAPERLYEHGLNREHFLPFLDELHRRVRVLELKGDEDYRYRGTRRGELYFFPLGTATTERLKKIWFETTNGAAPQPKTLEVQGRPLILNRTALGVCWCTFAELCEGNLGIADYMAIIETFSLLIISDIPALRPHQVNAAYRFRSLVDLLYERSRVTVFSAAKPLDEFYSPEGVSMYHINLFQRTRSRLQEMQSWRLGGST